MKLLRKLAVAVAAVVIASPGLASSAAASSNSTAGPGGNSSSAPSWAPSPAKQAEFARQATPAQNAAINEQLDRAPGGVRIGPQALAYKDGNVIYRVAPNDLSDCPSGPFSEQWICLYRFEDHNGRMLKFNDPGYVQDLQNPWRFNNQTASWANTRDYVGFLRNFRNGTGWGYCMPAHANSPVMPQPYKNGASSIVVRNWNRCP